jgi:small-conductance mechanosensitive channel
MGTDQGYGFRLEAVFLKERKKRIFFLIKLLLLIFLLFYREDLLNILKDYFKVEFRILDSILFYLTGHLVIDFIRLSIVYLFLKKHQEQEKVRHNFILGITRVSNVLSVIILFLAIIRFFNVELLDIFTGVSIVAAAIAILSKDYISNMINGLIIMFSDQLSLDDYIKVGEYKGRIQDITLMNIHLINDDEDFIFVPNNTLMNQEVVNYSKQLVQKVTIDFEAPRTEMHLLEELEIYLKKELEVFSEHITPGSMVLKVAKIMKDHFLLKFQFVLLKENQEVERQVRRILPRKLIEFTINQQKSRDEPASS